MAESLTIKLDEDLGKSFDEAVHAPGGLCDHGDLKIIIKNKGTNLGNPIACLTFTVDLPDGTKARAQTVTTVRNLVNAGVLLEGHFKHFEGMYGIVGTPSEQPRN